MIDIFSLLLILAGIGIISGAIWIWKYKTNWSTLKKAGVTVSLAIGLIGVVSIGIIIWALSNEVGQGMWIDEVNKPLYKFEYAEITEAELEKYPALKNAVEGHHYEMNYTEWQLTQNFFDTKWSKRNTSFTVNESLERELNNRTITAKIRSIFASERYPIPENSYIKSDDRWYIIRRYVLFSITDYDVENELNSSNMAAGGAIVPAKLKSVFASNGFPLPEDARISRKDEGWIIPVGIGYTILKEEGRLTVYTGDEKTYEISRENGSLRVSYVGPQGSPIFKIREKYYKFETWVT